MSIEAREIVAKAIGVLKQYLAGTLELGGATIRGSGMLTLHVATDGEAVSIKATNHRPRITKRIGPLAFEGDLNEIAITDDEATIVIDGLPDIAIKIK